MDGMYAVVGVALEIGEREIFAVLGPNGAGKTTLLKTIAGLLRDQPKKGTIRMGGRYLERRRPEVVASAGIVFVPEDRGLFRELTVAENLELGLWGRRDPQVPQDLERLHPMFPVLRARPHHPARTPSPGPQPNAPH